MRARYYNPQIKRFINQDILTGNIGNNKSLNRYSYVEGNPVSYTDPFGLSPVHFILDVAGIWFPLADVINAGLYWIEGNEYEAMKSLAYVVPGVDIYGKFAKLSTKAGKCGKYIDTAADIITYGGYAGTIAFATHDTIVGGKALIDKYIVNGEDVSAETILEVATVAASGLQAGFGVHYYNKYLNVPDAPKISTSNIPSLSGKATSITQKITSKINDSLFLKALRDNSGKVDVDALLGKTGGKKSQWWHKGYVDDLSDTQIILGVKQSEKGMSTLGSSTRENAMSAGKAWVGDDYKDILDGKGNIIGYSSSDGMRAFRIQFKPKENIWRANFQENMMVNNPYPNLGQHSSLLRNVHIDITD